MRWQLCWDSAAQSYRHRAARGFVRSLDRASDLMEAACAAAVLVLLVLDAHLERAGKANHALALLETAQWLHARLAQLLEVWRTVEQS